MPILHTIRSRLNRLFPGGDRFALDGDWIVAAARHYPVRRVALESIQAWTAYPEMTFDIVDIRLVGGSVARWLDIHDDLLSILRDRVSDRETRHDMAELSTPANRHEPSASNPPSVAGGG